MYHPVSPRLSRALARRRRQVVSDLVVLSLVTAALFAMALAI
jgi:hypothetical protein